MRFHASLSAVMSATQCEQALPVLPREAHLSVRVKSAMLMFGICCVVGIVVVGCGESNMLPDTASTAVSDQSINAIPTPVAYNRADVCERVSAAYEEAPPFDFGAMVPAPPLENDQRLVPDLLATFGAPSGDDLFLRSIVMWAGFREMMVHDVAGQVAVYHAGEEYTRDFVGALCGFRILREMTKPTQETAACRFWQSWRRGELGESEMQAHYLLAAMETGAGEEFPPQIDAIMGLAIYKLMMESGAGVPLRIPEDAELVTELNYLVDELGNTTCLYELPSTQ